MRTGLVIADFEMSFSTSFKHTARVKYQVDFNNSNISDTLHNLEKLKHNMISGIDTKVHVGLPITLLHVENVELLLRDLVDRYKQHSKHVPMKVNTLIHHLREFEIQTPQQIAREVLSDILTPKSEKQSRSKRLEADAEALSKQRAINELKKMKSKNSAKK